MRRKISVVFFLGMDPIKSINFYGLEEDEVRFLIDQEVVAKDVDWAHYKVL